MKGEPCFAGFVDTVEQLIASVVDTSEHLIAGVVVTGEQLIAGVVVTLDKHKVVNISGNFRKNLKWPQ